MFDHETAVLNNLDALACKAFRKLIIVDSHLSPDRGRTRREQIVKVPCQVLAPPEHIDKIDLSWNSRK